MANRGAFKKGNKVAVGNVGSRPRTMITQVIISQLNETYVDIVKGKRVERSRLHKIVDMLLKAAEKGDTSAAKEIFDRVQGRPMQTVNARGEGVITIVVDPEDKAILDAEFREVSTRRLEPPEES